MHLAIGASGANKQYSHPSSESKFPVLKQPIVAWRTWIRIRGGYGFATSERRGQFKRRSDRSAVELRLRTSKPMPIADAGRISDLRSDDDHRAQPLRPGREDEA